MPRRSALSTAVAQAIPARTRVLSHRQSLKLRRANRGSLRSSALLQNERFGARARALCQGFAAWGQGHLRELNAKYLNDNSIADIRQFSDGKERSRSPACRRPG